MSISGKMSVGIRVMVTTPRIAMSMAITTNVYGRRSASRTIHMICGFPRGLSVQAGCREKNRGFPAERGAGPRSRLSAGRTRCKDSDTMAKVGRVGSRRPQVAKPRAGASDEFAQLRRLRELRGLLPALAEVLDLRKI